MDALLNLDAHAVISLVSCEPFCVIARDDDEEEKKKKRTLMIIASL